MSTANTLGATSTILTRECSKAKLFKSPLSGKHHGRKALSARKRKTRVYEERCVLAVLFTTRNLCAISTFSIHKWPKRRFSERSPSETKPRARKLWVQGVNENRVAKQSWLKANFRTVFEWRRAPHPTRFSLPFNVRVRGLNGMGCNFAHVSLSGDGLWLGG